MGAAGMAALLEEARALHLQAGSFRFRASLVSSKKKKKIGNSVKPDYTGCLKTFGIRMKFIHLTSRCFKSPRLVYFSPCSLFNLALGLLSSRGDSFLDGSLGTEKSGNGRALQGPGPRHPSPWLTVHHERRSFAWPAMLCWPLPCWPPAPLALGERWSSFSGSWAVRPSGLTRCVGCGCLQSRLLPSHAAPH